MSYASHGPLPVVVTPVQSQPVAGSARKAEFDADIGAADTRGEIARGLFPADFSLLPAYLSVSECLLA